MARSYDIAILSQKVEQMEGSIKANDVIANPSGETTGDLTSIQIDGVKLNVPHTANKISFGESTVDAALNDLKLLVATERLTSNIEGDVYPTINSTEYALISAFKLRDSTDYDFAYVDGYGYNANGDYSIRLKSGAGQAFASKTFNLKYFYIKIPAAPTQAATSTRSRKKKEE